MNSQSKVQSPRVAKRTACLLLLCLPFLKQLQSQTVTGAPTQPVQGRSAPGGQAVVGSASLHQGAASVAPEDVSTMKLTPGSMVQLRVLEEADMDGSYRLDDRGNISLAWVGPIRLDGLNLSQAEDAIKTKLVAAQVLKVANVSVNLVEYSAKNIVVLGEVAAPGTFPSMGPHKLRDVLALAGGETQLAGDEIAIQRFGSPTDQPETIHYNRNANDPAPMNIVVNPGDSVMVKRAGVVYILGAVNRPGGYVLQEHGQLDVDQALAMAMGTSLEAKVTDIKVFRKMADGSSVEFQVDYKKINNGKATPLGLKAEDVVYVPPSGLKEIMMRGGTTVMNTAAAAAIYTTY